MSDTELLPDLPRPASASSLRDRVGGWAESLDLSLTRLALGAAVLIMIGVAAWRLLAPEPSPPEMVLPMATGVGEGAAPTAERSEPDGAGTGGGGGGEDESPTAIPADEVVVHVAGAVREPGVHRLAAGARLIDAVDSAGGVTDDADVSRVNLAASIEDGQHIYLPSRGEEPPLPLPVQGSAGVGGAGMSPAQVNVNTAGPSELEELPGVGPAIAQAIVDHRESRGAFGSVEQLVEVRGIGEVKLEGLRDHATV